MIRASRALLLLAACVASMASIAASVEFKLTPSLKGREQLVATQLAQRVGADAANDRGNGVYSVSLADEAAAATVATALREQGSVLWAESAFVDAPAIGQTPVIEYHSRMLTLTINPGVEASLVVATLARRTGLALTLKRVSNGSRALVELPKGTNAAGLAAVAVAASAEPSIRSAEPVRILRHQWLPNDTMYAQQWALGKGVGGIRAAQAWDLTPAGTIAVAVIDTGIRSHPELDGKRMAGYDMIADKRYSGDDDGRDADATDAGDADAEFECSDDFDFMSSWHGTHVAGIIAASSNNGAGMTGVAPNARIIPVRVLGRCGGTELDVADAIRWAAGVPVAGVPLNNNPAKVLNLSLGGKGPCSNDMQSAVDGAVDRGSVVVVAAGNDGKRVRDFSPANCRGVIAVAAGNLLGDLSSYSNFGTGIAITAPGGDSGDMPGVVSTLNGGTALPAIPSYATYSGTSMAAPHVAGVVALMLMRDPTLSVGQVINRLLAGARLFVAGSDCGSVPGACGAGLLDAVGAVNRVVPTRALADIDVPTDRLRLVELRDAISGRYLLTADPVEILQVTGGRRGGNWSRTGFAIDTFSFTAQFNVLAIAQPVCRARLFYGSAFVYSTNVEECAAYAANSGYVVDGMAFAAAMPSTVCSLGSAPVYEMQQLDRYGYNIRNVLDNDEFNRMTQAGWAMSRIAFCVPESR